MTFSNWKVGIFHNHLKNFSPIVSKHHFQNTLYLKDGQNSSQIQILSQKKFKPDNYFFIRVVVQKTSNVKVFLNTSVQGD